MEINKKAAERNIEELIYRERPSQLPVNVTRASYMRMLGHAQTFGHGVQSVWRCKKNGAKILGKMTFRNVFDRETGLCTGMNIPVAILFCSACDTPPPNLAGQPIYAEEIQTLSM